MPATYRVGVDIGGTFTDIVLLGYSYGGMVVTGALEYVADRVAHLVYLDAFKPDTSIQAPADLPEASADRDDAFARLEAALRDHEAATSHAGATLSAEDAAALGELERWLDALKSTPR